MHEIQPLSQGDPPPHKLTARELRRLQIFYRALQPDSADRYALHSFSELAQFFYLDNLQADLFPKLQPTSDEGDDDSMYETEPEIMNLLTFITLQDRKHDHTFCISPDFAVLTEDQLDRARPPKGERLSIIINPAQASILSSLYDIWVFNEVRDEPDNGLRARVLTAKNGQLLDTNSKPTVRLLVATEIQDNLDMPVLITPQLHRHIGAHLRIIGIEMVPGNIDISAWRV